MSDELSPPPDTERAGRALAGRGYKGWDLYADPRSCTLALFDLQARADLDWLHVPTYEDQVVTGDTASDYLKKLSANATVPGTYSGFSGEVTATFSDEILHKSKTTFVTVHQHVTSWRVAITGRAALMPEVARDLAAMDAAALFDKYGTHYVRSFYLGARISFSSYVDTTTVGNTTDVSSSAKVAFGKLEGSAGGSDHSKQEVTQLLDRHQLRIVGGDPTKGRAIITRTGDPAASYDAWAASVAENLSIANFEPGGLVPLYELAPPERRAELQEACQSYIAARTAASLLEGGPLVYGEPLYLKSADGRYVARQAQLPRNPTAYVGPWPWTVITNDMTEYYATIDTGGRVKVTLQGGDPGKEVKFGDVVQIKTLEATAGEYNLLGAWARDNCLYYHRPGYEEQDWVLQSATPSAGGYEEVKAGAALDVVSYRAFKGQRLAAGETWQGKVLLTTTTGRAPRWHFDRAS